VRRVVLLLAVATLAGPACRRAPGAPTPGVVRIAHEGEIFSLDPITVAESVTHSVLSNVYEGLVTFDRDMALVPALAVNWNNVEDDTWVLELRPGVRFHDGTPLTAQEVASALERARSGQESAVRGHLGTIAAIEAPSELRLVLRTTRRDPLLVNRLTYVLIARDGRGPGGAFRAVGTGPYEVVSWQRGQPLEARAFAGYWGGRPAIARARFMAVDESQALGALGRTDVDVLRFLPDTQTEQVRALPGLRVVSRPGLTTYYLWFSAVPPADGAKNPFADRRVRQAVSLAVDRQEIVRRLGGRGVPANQFVEKGVFGFVSGLPPLPYDPGRARLLMSEAGFKGGFEVDLVHRAATSVDVVMGAVREMLGAIDIRVRPRVEDWPVIIREWSAARLPFFYAGWRFESGDAHSFFVDCLMTRDASHREGTSNPGLSSPELDALIEGHAEIFGQANRLRHYEKLTRVALAEMPLVPLFTRNNNFAVSRSLVWEPRLDGKLLAREMSFRAEEEP
jgi:peptide/nickel transport system substrate-binding protein